MAKIAIVTGATGGLGQEFIKEIQKIDEIDEIWAVGRNEKKLEELRKKYSIIRPVIADFSTDGVEVIKQKIQKELRANIDDVRFLINNAGIGYMGHFDKQGKDISTPGAFASYFKFWDIERRPKICLLLILQSWIFRKNMESISWISSHLFRL